MIRSSPARQRLFLSLCSRYRLSPCCLFLPHPTLTLALPFIAAPPSLLPTTAPPTLRPPSGCTCIIFRRLMLYLSRPSLSLCTCAPPASTSCPSFEPPSILESLLWNTPSRVFFLHIPPCSPLHDYFRPGIKLSVHPSIKQSLHCTIALTYPFFILLFFRSLSDSLVG